MIIGMREQKTFGKRTAVSGGKEVHRKYLILSEGFQTEPIYFSALRAYSEALGISSLVDIIPIERSSLEKGFSNPNTSNSNRRSMSVSQHTNQSQYGTDHTETGSVT